MASLQQLDLFETTLSASYTAGGTSLTLTSVTGLPASGDYWLAVYDSANSASTYEVFKATSGASGSVVTVVGAQATTTAKNHASGQSVYGGVLCGPALTQFKADAGGSGGRLFSGSANPNGATVDVAPHSMTAATTPAPYTITTSPLSFGNTWSAFDKNTGNGFVVSVDATGLWVVVDLGSGNATSLGSYAITMRPDIGTVYQQRQPRNWTIDGSNNGTTWTTVDTRTGQGPVAEGSTVTYSFSSATTAYRYWRINVTLNNSGSNIEIAEMFYYQPPTGVVTSGVDGDFYIDVSAKKFYGPKASGAWPLIGSLT